MQNDKLNANFLFFLFIFYFEQSRWCPHHESNVDLELRSLSFYPLNYGGILNLSMRS